MGWDEMSSIGCLATALRLLTLRPFVGKPEL
uniref:Uncharacterized protein n=1 Tax=Physcomitrium patens TaxID=3218 RepID=A0A7I4CBR4_PHYPA